MKKVKTLIIISIIILTNTSCYLFNSSEDINSHYATWDSQLDNFTTNFTVGNDGRIYLKAKINNKEGLFLFDTGAALSLLNEQLLPINYKKGKSLSVTDAKNISKRKRLAIIDSFKFEVIKIKNLKMYPGDSLSWIHPKGMNYKKDSIFGVMGNNIISHYTWDFNMSEKTVTISNAANYCKDLSNSNAVDLIKSKYTWEIPLLINDYQKKVLLDFGSSSTLNISDSIPSENKFNFEGGFKFYDNHRTSVFSHINSKKEKRSTISFVDVSLGNHKFERVRCAENNHSNLLGIPFIWAFERVVLNFKSDKAYFISEQDSAGEFGLKEISNKLRNRFLTISLIYTSGKTEVMLRNEYDIPTKIIGSNNDTLNAKYKLFGNIIYYGGPKGYEPKDSIISIESVTIDSIASIDSLILPNGSINYGKYTIDLNKEFFTK